MSTKLLGLAALACAAAALLATSALAQVVREADTYSLAGVLDEWNPADDFSFSSRGNQILFANIDSEFFQVRGRRGGDHGEEDEGHEPGAGGSGGHEEGDGCEDEEGGGAAICLQVFDATGTMICWADRPLRPGWQRDPALACPLPSVTGIAGYTLRVSFKGTGCGPGRQGGHEVAAASATSPGEGTPYLMNWSLRTVAGDGQMLSQSLRN